MTEEWKQARQLIIDGVDAANRDPGLHQTLVIEVMQRERLIAALERIATALEAPPYEMIPGKDVKWMRDED